MCRRPASFCGLWGSNSATLCFIFISINTQWRLNITSGNLSPSPSLVFLYRSPPSTRRRSRKKRRKRRRRKRKRSIITITTTAMEVERSLCRMAPSRRRSLCRSVSNNHNIKLNRSLLLICKLWVRFPKSELVQQNVHVQRIRLILFLRCSQFT